MILDQGVCTGCGQCVAVCPIQAISLDENDVAEINKDECVECGVCLRSAECPVEAFSKEDLEFPRAIRRWFSDNTEKVPTVNSATLGSGRGVDEVKTNDRTGFYKKGEVGFIIEPGRPGISTGMSDVQIVLREMYQAGFSLTDRSPLKAFVVDDKMGILQTEILGERVLSCSLEFKGIYSDIESMVTAIERASQKVETVLCIGVISRVENWKLIPLQILDDLGYQTMPNGKVNIGLGRPLINQ